MDERYSKLEITPKLIDFGSRVVQMKLVTSVGLGTINPSRDLAKFLYLISLLLIVAAFSGSGAHAFGVYDPKTTLGWAGAVGLLLGTVAWNKTKRLLVIMLAGGEKIVLAGIHGRFLEKLLDRVREAMVAPENAPIHYTVNIKAETIETRTLVDLSRTSVEHSPGAAVVTGDALAPVATNGAGHAASNGRPTTAAPKGERPRHASPPPLAVSPSRGGLHSGHSAVVSNSPAGVAVGGNVMASTITTTASVGEDLSSMIALVEASSIAERQQVLEYLRYLHSLATAGSAKAAEVRASWPAFFEYAVRSLTGIDGFMAIAERVHRWYMRESD